MSKITAFNAHLRWLKDGSLVKVGQRALKELQINDLFINENMLCKVKNVSPTQVVYTTVNYIDHATSLINKNVEQVKFAL